MEIEKIPEYELTGEVKKTLQDLLTQCFPDALSQRIYFKQLPQFRYLGWEDNQLIAQMGVEHRMITLGSTPKQIFGVIDLCVAPISRKKGYAEQLLQELTAQASQQNIDHILLFADDHRIYERVGFTRVDNHCKWFGIDEHKSIGIIERSLADCMMVKDIGKSQWSKKDVDLLGYLF